MPPKNEIKYVLSGAIKKEIKTAVDLMLASEIQGAIDLFQIVQTKVRQDYAEQGGDTTKMGADILLPSVCDGMQAVLSDYRAGQFKALEEIFEKLAYGYYQDDKALNKSDIYNLRGIGEESYIFATLYAAFNHCKSNKLKIEGNDESTKQNPSPCKIKFSREDYLTVLQSTSKEMFAKVLLMKYVRPERVINDFQAARNKKRWVSRIFNKSSDQKKLHNLIIWKYKLQDEGKCLLNSQLGEDLLALKDYFEKKLSEKNLPEKLHGFRSADSYPNMMAAIQKRIDSSSADSQSNPIILKKISLNVEKQEAQHAQVAALAKVYKQHSFCSRQMKSIFYEKNSKNENQYRSLETVIEILKMRAKDNLGGASFKTLREYNYNVREQGLEPSTRPKKTQSFSVETRQNRGNPY